MEVTMRTLILVFLFASLQTLSTVSAIQHFTHCLEDDRTNEKVSVSLDCANDKIVVSLVYFGRLMTEWRHFCDEPETFWLHYRIADKEETDKLKAKCDGEHDCDRKVRYDHDKYEDLWTGFDASLYVNVEYRCMTDSEMDAGIPEIHNPMRETPFFYDGPELILLSEGYPDMREHFKDFSCEIDFQSIQFQVLDFKHDDTDDSPFCIDWKDKHRCATGGVLLMTDIGLATNASAVTTTHLNFTATPGATSAGRFWMRLTALQDYSADPHIQVSCEIVDSVIMTTKPPGPAHPAASTQHGISVSKAIILCVAVGLLVLLVSIVVGVCIALSRRRRKRRDAEAHPEPDQVQGALALPRPTISHGATRQPEKEKDEFDRYYAEAFGKGDDDNQEKRGSLPPQYTEITSAPPSYSEIDYPMNGGVVVVVRDLANGYEVPVAAYSKRGSMPK